jgi:REP element-mobilizing transposase RayT
LQIARGLASLDKTMRKTKFANNEYYHIYNRGVDKRDIFMDKGDLKRFILFITEALVEKAKEAKPLARIPNLFFGNFVELICYCLNPNHYHFILKQLKENGISRFMQSLGTSYTMFFNSKYNRSGSLFQGTFKSIHINTNEYLLWLSGYVNGNDRIHQKSQKRGLTSLKEVKPLECSSYPDYLGLRNGTLCNQKEMKIILDQFPNIKEYEKFVEMVIKESKKRKDVEKYLLEV